MSLMPCSTSVTALDVSVLVPAYLLSARDEPINVDVVVDNPYDDKATAASKWLTLLRLPE
eukprot:6174674-Pleurochrysis_carterae.AAC.2